MDPYDLIRIQLALEGIGVDAAGDLIRIPGPAAEAIPRCYMAATPDTSYVFYRHDLAFEVRSALAALDPDQLFKQHARVVEILAADAPAESPGCYTTYVVPPSSIAHAAADVVRLTERHRPLMARYDHQFDDLTTLAVYAIIAEGQIAATCCSARESALAGEAWVYTAPAYRRRGYARQVTAAWAAALHQQQKIAFYSHQWDNLASQWVAESLGLSRVYRGVNYL